MKEFLFVVDCRTYVTHFLVDTRSIASASASFLIVQGLWLWSVKSVDFVLQYAQLLNLALDA
jgi:hypothetical protein